MKPGSVAPETKLLKGCKKVSVDKNKKKCQHNNKKHYCNLNEMSPFFGIRDEIPDQKGAALGQRQKNEGM